MVNIEFDYEGHRGARGLMPENTIASMKKAIDLGVTTIEFDVVISKDHQVVVSHDHYFNELFTTTPKGRFLTKSEAQKLLLYKMEYDSIRKYDVGLKPHPNFPQQEKIQACKPLLSELIDSVEVYSDNKIRYNVEIKSAPDHDGVRHPEPITFCELLVSILKDKNVLERSLIQSFDIRPLQYIHTKYPSITLGYLVEPPSTSFNEQLEILGFIPHTYSPHYSMVTKALVTNCHNKGMKIIPWTVNSITRMNTLIDMGVDGIISDYPNLFSQINKPIK